MSPQNNRKTYKRLAFSLSLCAIFIWTFLGAGTSLAWFTDTSEPVKNVFHIADYELDVSYRSPDGKWESLDGKTNLFDDKSHYEPGYTNVLYLRVKNRGDRSFNFYAAVGVTDYTVSTNVYGQRFCLQDYLTFGIGFADTEQEMEAMVATRAQANRLATQKLRNYATNFAPLASGETAYIALVIHMPESVGNEANYRGSEVPRVALGMIVKAEQQK